MAVQTNYPSKAQIEEPTVSAVHVPEDADNKEVTITQETEDQKLEKMIDAHWAYIESLLRCHNASQAELKTAEFHYKSAFKHGWKHAKEDSPGHTIDLNQFQRYPHPITIYGTSEKKQGGKEQPFKHD